MATTVFDLTSSWVEIGTGPALFIIKRTGDGDILINNAQDDGTARRLSGPDEIGRQIQQLDGVSTYARATGTGWRIAATPEGGGRLPDGAPAAGGGTTPASNVTVDNSGWGESIDPEAETVQEALDSLNAFEFMGNSRPILDGISVFANDNLEAGTWADNTAANAAGTPFVLFNATAPAACAFIVSPSKFVALEYLATVAMVSAGGHVIEAEYSTGAGWTAVPESAYLKAAPYTRFGYYPFERAQAEYIHLSDIDAVWNTQTVNGVSGYALRWRILPGAVITGAPTVSSLKIIGNGVRIDPATGKHLLFGNARRDLAIIPNRMSMEIADGNSPGNYDLAVTANMTINAIKNRFNNGALDKAGQLLKLNPYFEGASGIKITLGWAEVQAGQTGNVEWVFRVATAKPGDTLNNTLPENVVTPTPIAVSGSAGLMRQDVFIIPADSFTFDAKSLAVTIERDARASNPNDTASGNVFYYRFDVDGKVWVD